VLIVAEKKKAPKPAMSAGHKAALAAGREEGRAVRRYLEVLEANRPKRDANALPSRSVGVSTTSMPSWPMLIRSGGCC